MKDLTLAGCVIYNVEGAILLLHRNKRDRVQWELPGGKLEPGEDAETAAIREIKEELGVNAKIIRHLGKASFDEDSIRHVYLWYEATIARAPSICEPQNFDDLAYWPIQDLKNRTDISANLNNLLRHLALS